MAAIDIWRDNAYEYGYADALNDVKEAIEKETTTTDREFDIGYHVVMKLINKETTDD